MIVRLISLYIVVLYIYNTVRINHVYQPIVRKTTLTRTTPPQKPDLLFSTTHKWGTQLSTQIRNNYFKSAQLQYLKFLKDTKKLNTTIKIVVFARNVVESVVSGYLYHKSGKECWLDSNGRPGSSWMARNPCNFGFCLENLIADKQLYKNTTKNLCEILRDTDLYTGITIYTKVVYNFWYKYAFEVKKSQPNNVLYLCMKDIQPNIPEAVAKIKAFRDGSRKDPSMQPMVANLSDEDIANIAAYYSSMK